MRAPHGAASLAAAAAAAAGLLAGCGGSSSSTPAYCAARTNLQQSVEGLKNVDIKSGGVNAVKAQLQTVEGDAKAVVSSAKQDFPNQTGAISSSVSTLSTAVKDIPSSPSASDLLAVGQDVANVTNAVKGFVDATGSNC
jgi:hypothetical protein